MTFSRFSTALVIAATLFGTVATTVAPAAAQGWGGRGPYYPRHHYHHRDNGGDAAAAAALGLVGGLIIGGLAAQSAQPRYVYEDQPYVVRRAPRVYYEEPRRVYRSVPRCRTLIKYDMYGRPYEYKDCD